MKRINVIGTSGSGKSHFSKRLATRIGVPYIEMDAVFWRSNWRHLEIEEFIAALKPHLQQDSWVLDGNQSNTNSVKWQYVDTIIWLDYGFFHTLRQMLQRSIKRAYSKCEIWEGTGNSESFRRNFFSSESVVLWMLQNYAKTKKKYSRLFADPPSQGIRCIRISSRTEADAFLDSVAK